MEAENNLLESLLEKATDYGKTSFELVKLKALDKTTDVVSSLVPNSIVIILIASFLLFFNLALALWAGDILGRLFYGFFAVAAFYMLAAGVIHFVMHERIKKIVRDYIIKFILK